MANSNSIVILDNHFDGENTLIYNAWVMNGCQFFESTDARVRDILKEYKVPQSVWQQVLDAIKTGKGTAIDGEDYSEDIARFAYTYSLQVEADDEMNQALIDTGYQDWAFKYCRQVSDDDAMRQVILDESSPKWAYYYCLDVSDDADMRQVILDEGDAEWAYMYCREVRDDDHMRKVILDANIFHWADRYCLDIREDSELRKITDH